MAKKNKFFGDAADEIARLNKEMAETNAILSSVAKALSENAKSAAEFTGDTAPTATTTASRGDMFNFRYNGTKWLEVGRNLNLVLS